MSDMNIYVKNLLGKGNASNNRLSAKGSIQRKQNTINSSNKLKRVSNTMNTMGGIGSNLSLTKTVKGVGVAGLIVGTTIALADKVVSFGINLREASTGESIRANNSRTVLKTIGTMGTNLLYGAIGNELFTKKVISRQNFGLDYGREIYQINVEGTKNKRI